MANRPTRVSIVWLLSVAFVLTSCGVADSPWATRKCTAATTNNECEACCTTNGTNRAKIKDGTCNCQIFYWHFLQ